MENWFYLPSRIFGLEPGTSFQIGAEEVGDGEDLGTAGAFTADAHFSAHQIALVTALVSQEALVARRALVHGPIDKSLRLMQLVREPGQRWLLRLTATESKSALAAGWAAIHADRWASTISPIEILRQIGSPFADGLDPIEPCLFEHAA